VTEEDIGFITGCEHDGSCTEVCDRDENGRRKDVEDHEVRCACAAAYYADATELPYDADGRLTQTFEDGVYTHQAVYECGPQCKCGDECPLRVVTKGRKLPLDVFKTKNRGWGMFALNE